MSKPDRIYVMLPVYNEEGALPLLFDGISGALEGGTDYEIIVVNDGSTDGSRDAANKNMGKFPITLLEHETNKGLGVAVRTGFDYILDRCNDNDVIVTLDADNSHDPGLIPGMVEKLETGCGLVIASRFVKGGKQIGLSYHRRLISWGFGIFVKAIGIKGNVRDWTCGYRAYKAAVLKGLRNSYGGDYITQQGFVVMFEVLFKLFRLGEVRPVEVPLVLRYDMKIGRSKMKIARAMMQYIVFVLRESVFGGRAGRAHL